MLAWPYLFQNYALGDLAQWLEIYGIPARVGQYPRNASDKEKLTLLRAVTSLGSNAAGIIPEGMKIEFMEAADGKADMFTTMMTWCERSKAKVVLGGTLTSGTGEGTNTNALGNVHERALDSLIRSDIRQYGGTINRDILWPMASLNFGIDDRRRAPQFKLDMGETEDFAVLSESLPKFVEMGARIPMWWFHEKSGIPEAGDKDEVLVLAKPTPTTPPELPPQDAVLRIALAALKGASNSPQSALDDVLSAINPATQQSQAEALLKPIKDRIQSGDNYDAIRDELSDLYPDLDVSGVEDMLTRLFFVAETWGRLNS
jgi:phage gp29-like protein